MRVLIIGGAGLVGSSTARSLQTAGHDVIVADLAEMRADYRDIPWIPVDIRRASLAKSVMGRVAPDTVVHLAALHFIPYCNSHPAATLQTNVIGIQNVIAAMEHAKISSLVFSSSAAVYAPSSSPISEEAAVGPDDIYGHSKVFGEQILQLARSRTRLGIHILRLFNVIGPNDPNSHLIPRIVDQIREGGDLKLGNLDSVRDYVYVGDVADAIVRTVEHPTSTLETFNIGTGKGHSVREVISVAESLVGRPLRVSSAAGLQRAIDRPVLLANPALARKQLGWVPRTNFTEGLKRILDAAGVPVVSLPTPAATSQSPKV